MSGKSISIGKSVSTCFRFIHILHSQDICPSANVAVNLPRRYIHPSHGCSIALHWKKTYIIICLCVRRYLIQHTYSITLVNRAFIEYTVQKYTSYILLYHAVCVCVLLNLNLGITIIIINIHMEFLIAFPFNKKQLRELFIFFETIYLRRFIIRSMATCNATAFNA